jgi:L-alanine-DL-glutamate epimerase-like enolase superfamily enzyme
MLGFDYATEVLFRIAEDAARKAVGSDARFRNETWRKLWTDYEYIGRDGVAAWGVAAVDLALWDLYGHQTGQPVWALVGGTKQAIPAYGSGGWLSNSEKELIGEAEAYLKRGLGAYKSRSGWAWRRTSAASAPCERRWAPRCRS